MLKLCVGLGFSGCVLRFEVQGLGSEIQDFRIAVWDLLILSRKSANPKYRKPSLVPKLQTTNFKFQVAGLLILSRESNERIGLF